MEGRGRSRRRNIRREWEQRLGSAMALILTISMVLNMPLSWSRQLGISNVYASASNAKKEDAVWATASNAKYKQGDESDVDIYVVADDNEIVPGNVSSMTLYLRNNTGEEITDGVLTFAGKKIKGEDGWFTGITEVGSEETGVITGKAAANRSEPSGEGLLDLDPEMEAAETEVQLAAALEGQADRPQEAEASIQESGQIQDVKVSIMEPDDREAAESAEAAEREAEFGGEEDEEEENESSRLTDIDLLPGQLYEVSFEFYTEDDLKSQSAYVKFRFAGEGSRGVVKGETKFYYSIGLPVVNLELEGGSAVETGIENEMNIWMSEPDWVDDHLEEILKEQESKKTEKEEEANSKTASSSDAGKATASNAKTASSSNASGSTSSYKDLPSVMDAAKIEKYTDEAMEIKESKVSYTVELWGTRYKRFSPKKAEEVEDIGWISCIYELAGDQEPGIYYGKVTAKGKWNRKSFTSEQGFLFEVTGEHVSPAYHAEAKLDNVTIHVSADEGVLPEGTRLFVKELKEDDAETADKFLEAKEALDAEGTEYSGMMALDMAFFDEDGNKIEPDSDAGNVRVSMEMNSSLLPKDADLGSVAVQHLAEREAGIEVQTVADVTDAVNGTVEVREAEEVVAVDFEVESFSVFAVTWGGTVWNRGTITVQYMKVDSNGELEQLKLTDDQSQAVALFSSNTFNLSDFTNSIQGIGNDSGYTYRRTILEDNAGTMIADYASDAVNTFRRSNTNQLQYYSDNEWSNISDGSTINLIYTADEALATVDGLNTEGTIQINVFDYEDSDGLNNFKFGGGEWTGYNGGVRQGIVNSNLVNGYPQLAKGGCLRSLFTKSNKISGNYLFQQDGDGYYYYNSGQNFAELDSATGKFTLYDVPRSSDEAVPPSFPQFLPFNTLSPVMDSAKNDYAGDPNRGKYYQYHRLNENSTNYYFGMNIGFDFIQPKNGQITNNGVSRDMVFEFEGDDDVWVFIDGVLVLDMGGVHDNYKGSINFATGDVEVEKVYGVSAEPVTTTISEMFTKAGKSWNGNDYSLHELQFFYLERGGGGSNCSIKFNLPTIPKGTINFQKHLEYANVADAADFEFEFKIYVNYAGSENGSYSLYEGRYEIYNASDLNTPISSGQAENGIIKLKDGQVARLVDENIQVTSKFYVEEVGATSDKYDVTVNGVAVDYTYEENTTTQMGVRTKEFAVGEAPYITFQNKVSAENQFNLQIKKNMWGDNVPESSFQVKLLLGEGSQPYTGSYDVYNSAGQKVSSNLSAGGRGIISLQAGQYAQITGLIGGNQIRIEEVDLSDEYGIPDYSMTGVLLNGSIQKDTSGISGTALEGKALGKDPVVIAEITNYTKPSVTITKHVKGNMGDRNRTFDFVIDAKDASGKAINVDGSYGDGENKITITDGKFCLKHNQSVTIPKLPVGSQVTVTETDYFISDGYQTTVKVGSEAEKKENTSEILKLERPTEIVFTNTKGVNIPTGIFDSSNPSLLMLVLAALGILGFTYFDCTKKKRRTRR